MLRALLSSFPLLFLGFLSTVTLRGQIGSGCSSYTVCPSGAACPASDNIGQAFIACGTQGLSYTGSTFGATPDETGSVAGCNGPTIENNQWCGFVAPTSSINATLEPGSCLNDGNGLQLFLFEVDCAGGGLGPPILCESPGTLSTITASVSDLCPNQTYMFMIDGFSGALCDFTFTITPEQELPDLTVNDANINGPAVFCPGQIHNYSV